MAKSYNRVVASGSTSVFAVPFQYIDRSHVKVFLDGVETTAFSWLSAGQVQLLAGNPAPGSFVKTARRTPAEPLVDFGLGNLDPTDLDTAAIQALFRAEEAADLAADGLQRNTREDQLSARGFLVEDLRNAEKPQDATTKAQLDAETGTLHVRVDGEAVARLSGDNALHSRVEVEEFSRDRGDRFLHGLIGDRYAADTVKPGDVSSCQAAREMSFPAPMAYLYTAGFSFAGDGGEATYRRGNGTLPGGFLDLDGNGWELAVSEPQVRQYGGNGDGTFYDDTAVALMASHVGYVRFTKGAYRLRNPVSVPLVFEAGAYITVDAGSTLVMSNRITSSRQWVFRGEGEYRINIITPTGEDAREIHASWFGAIPTNTAFVDLAPRIQKALNSLGGQTREGILQFDQGSYHVASGMTVPRGVHVRGAGKRRTVFDVTGEGYNVFSTDLDAVWFSDFQFEQISGTVGYRTGGYIVMNGRDNRAFRIHLWNGEKGIVANGVNAIVQEIDATYGAAHPAGTSAIEINENGAVVEGIRQMSSAFGPEAIVKVGGAAARNFGNCRIGDIEVSCPSIPVLLAVPAFSLSRVLIENITFGGSGSNTVPAVVRLVTTGTGSIAEAIISGITASANALAMVEVIQGSTGSTTGVVIDEVVASSAAGGVGIRLARTAGTLTSVHVGDTVDVSRRGTPIERSGTMSGVKISPQATPGANGAYCYAGTIADDAVMVIRPGRSIFSASAIITGPSNVAALFYLRVASGPACAAIGSPTNVAFSTGVLTGTTGTDGQLTISVTEDAIYVENRRGSQIAMNLALLSGA